MDDYPHILIIGAGLIGLSIADSLLRRHVKVTIIERHSEPGLGTSFSNSGMIHPSQSTPWIIKGVTDHLSDSDRQYAAKAVFDLASRSTPLIRQRMRTLKLQDAYRPPGVLQIFDDTQTRGRIHARYIDLGVATAIRAGSMFAKKPNLFLPDDRSGDAYIYCQVLANDIIKWGGTIVTDVQDLKLSKSAEPVRSVQFTYEGQKQDLSGDHIVLAAGPQSRDIAEQVGLGLPVLPVGGYALNFRRPHIDLPSVPVMHFDSHSALTVFENHVRISGGHDLADPEDLWLTWQDVAPRLVKALGTPTSAWTGQRPMSRTGKPLIGRTGVPNLWVNTGHGHMGWTLCAGSGELMADMILDGTSETRFALPAAIGQAS